jgi:hypothetical protein
MDCKISILVSVLFGLLIIIPFSFWFTHRIETNPSPVTFIVIGLNLLYLLVENRLADFHCEVSFVAWFSFLCSSLTYLFFLQLELLSAKTRSHNNISFCTQLEKHLVVGAYDEVSFFSSFCVISTYCNIVFQKGFISSCSSTCAYLFLFPEILIGNSSIKYRRMSVGCLHSNLDSIGLQTIDVQ